MKTFSIDIEAVSAASYEAGMTRVITQVTVRAGEPSPEGFSDLHMSEKTMRRLHEIFGKIIRNLDEHSATR
ncbi:hypothetical protein QMO14_17045 [Variovorax sp. CAN2819]|uniref:hypothetical protein n=1 Tax=Variovorax sp. CAN15 TaxID=3046727 RepID=UPI0026472447|nr:hypothetical protein [Variovorax sp. CAN15]MDN6885315.1 hypothetical protein [Variovorax sp. CAN15]